MFLFLLDQVECSHCCCVHVADADHLPVGSASTTTHDRTWRMCVVWCFLDRLCVICLISTGQILIQKFWHFGRCHRTWIKIYQMPGTYAVFLVITDCSGLFTLPHTDSKTDTDKMGTEPKRNLHFSQSLSNLNTSKQFYISYFSWSLSRSLAV